MTINIDRNVTINASAVYKIGTDFDASGIIGFGFTKPLFAKSLYVTPEEFWVLAKRPGYRRMVALRKAYVKYLHVIYKLRRLTYFIREVVCNGFH